jgi:hypothetical protein
MNYFSRIILAAATGLLLLTAGISFARAADCPANSIEQSRLIQNFTEKEGHAVSVLTEGDVARIIDKKGAPPNAEEGVPLEMVLVTNDTIAALFVFQKGCLINRIGPAPIFMIQQLFGQVSATVPYRQSLLMKEANFAVHS